MLYFAESVETAIKYAHLKNSGEFWFIACKICSKKQVNLVSEMMLQRKSDNEIIQQFPDNGTIFTVRTEANDMNYNLITLNRKDSIYLYIIIVLGQQSQHKY